MKAKHGKVWVLAADMGYGHQRAANPFRNIAYERIINMNTGPFTPAKEQQYWKNMLGLYEFISQTRKIPVIGQLLFYLMNQLLKIPDPEAKKDLTRPTFQVRMLQFQIRRGLCGGVMIKIREKPLPVLTSFYAPAIAADMAGFRDVYCIICDSDLNRVWVAKDAAKSRIKYFVPCREAAERLQQYGVSAENIFLTGFPLDPELTGGPDLKTAKDHFNRRMAKFDRLKSTAEPETDPDFDGLSVVFAVGGAGAQAEYASMLLNQFSKLLEKKFLKFTLVAGTKNKVARKFHELSNSLKNKQVDVLFGKSKTGYFHDFNKLMHQTDLLVTKPSELSFYAGLGIPILMLPPIGPQEEFNRRWLLKNRAAVDLPLNVNPEKWLLRMLASGSFGKMARSGFANIKKDGYFHILKILEKYHN